MKSEIGEYVPCPICNSDGRPLTRVEVEFEDGEQILWCGHHRIKAPRSAADDCCKRRRVKKSERAHFSSKPRYKTLVAALYDGEFEVRQFLNCCSDSEIRDSFQGFSKFQKRAAKLIERAQLSSPTRIGTGDAGTGETPAKNQ
jgi:hypothetical protein